MKTGVFSDLEILEALAEGQIIIDPFNEENLNSSSYDITLGENFYVCEADEFQADFNPYSQKEIERYYRGPLVAVTNKEWCERYRNNILWDDIEPNAKIIVLKPGECILGHTQEFVGAQERATTMMHARSTTGRFNISACDDAGWGDIGYINRWTMEIRNKNKVNVPLVVGSRIGQIIFFHAGETNRSYMHRGNYQSGDSLNIIKASWTATQMLPKRYRA